MENKNYKKLLAAVLAVICVITAMSVAVKMSDHSISEKEAGEKVEYADTTAATEAAIHTDMTFQTVDETYMVSDTVVSNTSTATEITSEADETSLTTSESTFEIVSEAVYEASETTLPVTVTHQENYAAQYSSKFEMGSEKYYTAFARALAEHDYAALAFLDDDTGGEMSFKHFDGVIISDYSVDIIDGSEFEPSGGKITLTITQSNDELFPVGKNEYYILLEDGMFEWLDFRPFNEESTYDYDQLDYASADMADALGYESYSTSQLKNMVYSPELIHSLYHTMFQNENGYSAEELNYKVKSFFDSDNDISRQVLSQLQSKDGRYFNGCNHGGRNYEYVCKSISENKNENEYIHDIWFYSDLAHLNVCRKIRFAYEKNEGNYSVKSIDC